MWLWASKDHALSVWSGEGNQKVQQEVIQKNYWWAKYCRAYVSRIRIPQKHGKDARGKCTLKRLDNSEAWVDSDSLF
jgi:hypothetical protein